MEIDLNQIGAFIGDHGLALFLVIGAALVLVYGLWKPPAWIQLPIQQWLLKKLEAIEREAQAQELIADSTRAISRTAEEIREALRTQERRIEEIAHHTGRGSQWLDDWGEFVREMFQRQFEQQ
ncbi:hypothetical protein [Rubinisphaera margarita]|uniref:hypothetical protein n=1 Tax=Rubinisphaera margarita TaxID=2909586 RepID=UPI001EE913AF|nr:hypothetical protein [Rubinisphaera margarita]MCG6157136.1 hypothetical protein [Rubinisphaera margarita]